MTILSTELLFYLPDVSNDTTLNGGRMTANQAISGVVNNIWPNVLKAERTAGSTKYRKLFSKNANDADLTLLSPQVWLDVVTAADDWITFLAGTQRNTQADLLGTERLYGCATLNTDITAGGSAIIVDVEDTSIVGIFADGDTIRLTDMATPDATTGNEEFLTITGAPVVSGTTITITVVEAIANSYTVAGGTRVMSVYSPADVACSVDNWVLTSSAGLYDNASYPPITDNIGTIEQTWTLTFADATTFSVSGDIVGAVGSGTITADFIPSNPDFTKPYFTLEYAGFSGTWAGGDTIVWQTHPASIPIWEKRVVPALAASLSGNNTTLVISGESA